MRFTVSKNLLLILFLFSIIQLNGQSNGKTIEARTQNAEHVFEGKIVNKTGFWNSKHDRIFTRHTIKVSRVFKGENNEFIDVITHGGVVDGIRQEISPGHGILLSIGEEGVFFCKYFDNSGKGDDVFLMLNGLSGIVLYDLDVNGIQGRDESIEYENIWKEILEPIITTTRQVPNVLGQNGFEELVEIWLESNLSVFSPTDTIIEFTFQNIEVIGGNEVEFDIFVKSNQNGIKFVAADIFLKYATNAFGSSVIQNEKLEATKETVLSDPIYTLELSDSATDIVKILVNSSLSPSSYYPISQIEEKFLHLKIDIENIVELANISFEDFLMTNQSMFFDSNTGENIPFSKIVVSPPVNLLGGPMIMSFHSEDMDNPHHTSAGTEEILTIIGMGFGETKGVVSFRNADLLGTSVTTSESDIELWTGIEIRVKVPSAASNFSGHTAGSGSFKIILPDEITEASSGDALFVDYSVYNVRSANMMSIPVDLADTPQGDGSADGTLHFSLSTNMSNNPMLRDIVNESLCVWNIQSQIKWSLTPSYSNKVTFGNNDMVNLIYFGEESEFTGGLMELGAYTILTRPLDDRKLTCLPGGGIIQREVDIVFRKGSNLVNANPDLTNGWHYTSISLPSPPNSGQVDFYSLLMHELGHAHLLRHTSSVENQNIMDIPQLSNGEVHRVPSSFDQDGGIHIIERSQEVGNSIFCDQNSAVAVIDEMFCSPTSIESINGKELVTYFLRNDNLVFSFPVDISGVYELSVFTIDGKKLMSQTVNFHSGEKEKIIPLNRLVHSNMYVFRLQSKENDTFFSGRFILVR